jgi:hypothetical protein
VRDRTDDGAGLDELEVPEAAGGRVIPAAAVARLLEISAVASGREDFGPRLVEFRRLANLGPLALVIREEPDVRSVLEMLIRYEHTYNQAISIGLSEANGLATIRMDLELGEPAGTRQAIELAVGTLHHIHRQRHGTRWQPLSVCFSHPAPADISTHLRIFGHVMQFQREFARIVLPAGGMLLGPPRSKPGRRIVGMPDAIIAALREHLSVFVKDDYGARPAGGQPALRRSAHRHQISPLRAPEAATAAIKIVVQNGGSVCVLPDHPYHSA